MARIMKMQNIVEKIRVLATAVLVGVLLAGCSTYKLSIVINDTVTVEIAKQPKYWNASKGIFSKIKIYTDFRITNRALLVEAGSNLLSLIHI